MSLTVLALYILLGACWVAAVLAQFYATRRTVRAIAQRSAPLETNMNNACVYLVYSTENKLKAVCSSVEEAHEFCEGHDANGSCNIKEQPINQPLLERRNER